MTISEVLNKSKEELLKKESELIIVTQEGLEMNGGLETLKVKLKVNTDKLVDWHTQQQIALLEAVKKWAEENKNTNISQGVTSYARAYNEALEDLSQEIDEVLSKLK